MAGPLAQVETLLAGINLDVNRQLYMGQNVTLRFLKPQTDGSGGTVVVREYTTSFDRDTDAERERGDGSQIIVDIADSFPVGQLRADIAAAKFIQFVVDGEESPVIEMDEVPAPAFNEGQVYRITCAVPVFKRNFFRVGRK